MVEMKVRSKKNAKNHNHKLVHVSSKVNGVNLCKWCTVWWMKVAGPKIIQ